VCVLDSALTFSFHFFLNDQSTIFTDLPGLARDTSDENECGTKTQSHKAFTVFTITLCSHGSCRSTTRREVREATAGAMDRGKGVKNRVGKATSGPALRCPSHSTPFSISLVSLSYLIPYPHRTPSCPQYELALFLNFYYGCDAHASRSLVPFLSIHSCRHASSVMLMATRTRVLLQSCI
jgi:hypothetical protein